jgi:hypothetical protein
MPPLLLLRSFFLFAEGLTGEQMAVEVLGDLPAEEARRYVCGDEREGARWKGLVAKVAPTKAGDVRQRLHEIYKVCGGNIGQLRTCLTFVRTKGVEQGEAFVLLSVLRFSCDLPCPVRQKRSSNDSCLARLMSMHELHAGLKSIKRLSTGAVEAGLAPSSLSLRASPPAWTTEQYKHVLRRIATAPHNVARQSELIEELGSSGNVALKSMVQYNLLAVRTQSTLARDLPEKVYYRGTIEDAVVTMPSPGRRFVVHQMLQQGMVEPSAGAALQLSKILSYVMELFG